MHLAPGSISKVDLIAGIKSGFYVTELIGMGVNTITGDYSRGAGGFWIENGEIAYPVNEVTIAGNLADMYMHMSCTWTCCVHAHLHAHDMYMCMYIM